MEVAAAAVDESLLTKSFNFLTVNASLAAVKRNGRSEAGGTLASFADLQALAGFPSVFDLERRYLTDLRRQPERSGLTADRQ